MRPVVYIGLPGKESWTRGGRDRTPSVRRRRGRESLSGFQCGSGVSPGRAVVPSKAGRRRKSFSRTCKVGTPGLVVPSGRTSTGYGACPGSPQCGKYSLKKKKKRKKKKRVKTRLGNHRRGKKKFLLPCQDGFGVRGPLALPICQKVSFGPSWQVLVKVCLRMGQRTLEPGPGDAHDDWFFLGYCPHSVTVG